jgi:hypothetical protein
MSFSFIIFTDIVPGTNLLPLSETATVAVEETFFPLTLEDQLVVVATDAVIAA